MIPGGSYKEVPLLHLIKFSLAPEHVEKILKRKSPKVALDNIFENLLIEESSPYFPQLVGCRNIEKNMKWTEIIASWRDEVSKSKARKGKVSESWIHELNDEIWRAINNKPATPEGNTLISVSSASSTRREYTPILCSMREYPDKKREFDVYFYLKK